MSVTQRFRENSLSTYRLPTEKHFLQINADMTSRTYFVPINVEIFDRKMNEC